MEEIVKICNNQLLLSGKIAIYTMVIPLIVAMIKWRSLNRILRFFFLYCLATLILNLVDLGYVYAVNNYTPFFKHWLEITDYSLNFLAILHQLKSFLLLGFFFSLLLANKNYGKGLWQLSLAISLVAVIAYIVEQGWRNYGVVGPTMLAFFLFATPFFYLWYLSRNSLSLPFPKNPYFLISLGLILPNLIGLILFFIGDSLRENDFCVFARFSIAKNCFVVLELLLFSLAFIRARFANFVEIKR